MMANNTATSYPGSARYERQNEEPGYDVDNTGVLTQKQGRIARPIATARITLLLQFISNGTVATAQRHQKIKVAKQITKSVSYRLFVGKYC
jgi:hypothetical protein